MDSEELTMKFMAVDLVTQTVENIANGVEKMAQSVMGSLGAVGKGFEAVGGAVAAVGGAFAAAGGALFGILDHLASKTAEYSIQVIRLSNTLGVSTTWLQTMYQAGGILGAGTDQLNLAFARFAKNIEDGGRQLKAAGLDLAAVGITSSNVEVAFGQLADKFHTMDDASQKLAISTLFGRNAMATLIPILNQGSEGIGQMTEEFTRMGLILNQTQLQLGAVAGVIHEKLQLQMKAVELQVGAGMETAFLVFWNVLNQVLGKGAGLVDVFTQAMSRAVIWVAAFVAALTGTSINLNQIIDGLGSVTAGLSLNQGAADAAGGSINQLAKSNKALTDALQDQITALQDDKAAWDDTMQGEIDAVNARKVAFDDAMQAETDAINTQKAAYDELVVAQQASLNEQIRQMDAAHALANAQQSLSDAQQKVIADQQDLAAAPFRGITDLGPLQSKLRADQEALNKQMGQMAFDSNKAQLEDKLRSLETQRKAQDSVFQSHIKQLEEQKKAEDRALGEQVKRLEVEKKAHDDMIQDQIKGLQERLKEAQRASQAQQDAALSSDSAILGSSDATTAGIRGFLDGLKTTFTTDFASMQQSGTDAFANIASAVQQVKDAIHEAQTAVIVFQGVLGETGAFIALMIAPVTALGLAIKGLVESATGDLPGAARDLADAAGHIGDIVSFPGRLQDVLNQEQARMANLNAGTIHLKGLPFGAEGAIVSKPTLAMIGDAGAEAIVPLAHMPGAVPLPPQERASLPPQDERALEELRLIRMALTAHPGSTTGLQALVQKLIEMSSYQRSRGSFTYAAAS